MTVSVRWPTGVLTCSHSATVTVPTPSPSRTTSIVLQCQLTLRLSECSEIPIRADVFTSAKWEVPFSHLPRPSGLPSYRPKGRRPRSGHSSLKAGYALCLSHFAASACTSTDRVGRGGRGPLSAAPACPILTRLLVKYQYQTNQSR